MKVVVYSLHNQGRAGNIAQAMLIGLRRHGVDAVVETRWRGDVRGDVAIAYGWKHEPVFSAYAAAGAQFAYFDLGYFNRHPSKDKGGSREGHHRLAVNGWDTADTMARGCPDDRWRDLGIEIAPDREPGGPGAILVVGMSEKAAGTHGFVGLAWERQALEAARAAANGREVIYRPKPRDIDAVEPIESVLKRTAFILTHHSNVAVDGLVAAVPCHATKGVGKLVSRPEGWFIQGAIGCSLAYRRPKIAERRALLADVAYAQWTPGEMRSGAAWEHIRKLLR